MSLQEEDVKNEEKLEKEEMEEETEEKHLERVVVKVDEMPEEQEKREVYSIMVDQNNFWNFENIFQGDGVAGTGWGKIQTQFRRSSWVIFADTYW